MSITPFGTEKNFGISDSLLDAVRGVVQGKPEEEQQVVVETEELEEKKLDPVGQEDDDVDNDGDTDSSDEYLKKRRKAIGKAMKGKKDEVDTDPKLDEEKLDEAMRVLAKKGKTQVVTKGDGVARVMVGGKEIASGDLDDLAGGWFMSRPGEKGQKFFDSPQKIADFYKEEVEVEEGLEDNKENPANSQHLCAKQVVHEEWGTGNPIHGMHAEPDTDGNIAWYDVMFDHGIEREVSIDEMKVTKSEMHMNHKKKK